MTSSNVGRSKRLIVSAFWVAEEDVDAVMVAVANVPGGIKGSGATVSFKEERVTPDLRHELCRFDLAEAADFDPVGHKDPLA